jgi:hypothetical protein
MKMMNGDTFIITEETFKKLIDKTGLKFITELNALINLNSMVSIVPETIAQVDERKLYDGTIAKLKGGIWVDKFSGAKIDIGYYKELRESNKLTVI